MNLLEKMEKEIEELEKKIQKLKEEFNKIEGEEFPKDGDEYYFIPSTGGVVRDKFWDSSEISKDRLSIGNVFKTKEDTEFMVERLKVLAEMKKISRRFVPNESNYEIYYHHLIEQIDIKDLYELQRHIYYFDTREEAKAAIEKIGEDRLKKYYFMVGEGE